MATKKGSAKQDTKKNEAKKADIRLVDMMPAELADQAKNLKNQISAANLERVAGKAKNSRQSYNLRKQLARTLTVLRNKSHA